MRPDCGILSTFRFIVSGEIEQNHINISIPVCIVITYADFGFQQVVGFQDGQMDAIIIIILLIVGKGYRAIHVELGTVLVHGVFDKVIPDRTDGAIPAIAGHVEHVCEMLFGIGYRIVDIRETSQDTQDLAVSEISCRRIIVRRPCTIEFFRTQLLGFCRLCRKIFIYGTIESIGHLCNYLAGRIVCQPVEIFITMVLEDDDTAVRLDVLEGGGIGLDRPEERSCKEQDQQRE